MHPQLRSSCQRGRKKMSLIKMGYLTLLIIARIFPPSEAKMRISSLLDDNSNENRFKNSENNCNYTESNDWLERMRAAIGIEEEYPTAWESDAANKSGYMLKVIQKWREMILMSVLNTRPSRGLFPGVKDALLNVMKGYYAGVQILLMYPFMGWNGSISDFVSDTAVGVFSGVLMAGSGVAAGVYNIKSGLDRTFDAIWGRRDGMIWGEYQSRWGYFSLNKEAAQLDLLLSQSTVKNRHQPNLRSRSKKRVNDLTYYSILKVPSDASSSELKQAYYKMAMDVHPDKNPLDKNAAKKFQSLSSAYQTLSNEEARSSYDTHGICFRSKDPRLTQQNQIDPYIFFATMFGSYLVEPYVGELSIASTIDSLLELGFEDSTRSAKQKKKLHSTWQQQKREVDIALNLRERIFKYVAGIESLAVFRHSCGEEARRIAKGDFGDLFLTTIGDALISSAGVYLGYQTSLFGLKGSAVSLMKTSSSILNNLSTTWEFGNTIRLSIGAFIGAKAKIKKSKNAHGENNSEGDGEGQCQDNTSQNPTITSLMMQKMEASLHSILKLGWKMNVKDISSTVTTSCTKLFAEPCTSEERRRRAEALQILGGEFLAVGIVNAKKYRFSKSKNDSGEMVERIEVALMASIVQDDSLKATQNKQTEKRTAAS